MSPDDQLPAEDRPQSDDDLSQADSVSVDDHLHDRFRGALVGVLVGDALGMPVEGWSGERIRRELGEVREMRSARLGRGTFTDDTQMTGALAEALLESDDPANPDPDRIARSFAEHFDPERGYGGNTGRILAAIRAGEPRRTVVERQRLPGGSFANGAAMRVAPAALAGFPNAEDVVRIADIQAAVTGHDHPEARLGARLQAVGVLAGLIGGPASELPDPRDLLARADAARRGSDGSASFVEAVEWVASHADAGPDEVARRVGNGVRAVEAVPAALWAFLSAPDEPEEALVTAVGIGGDTDTIAAMAGALVGARNGASALPGRWVEAVERGEEGLDGLIDRADGLYERSV